VNLGVPELLVIFLLIALIFGGKKLPELGKGLGEGIKNFKRSFKKDKDESTGEKGEKVNKGSARQQNEKDN
jgi:sec-independent protein translocase protein TatA